MLIIEVEEIKNLLEVAEKNKNPVFIKDIYYRSTRTEGLMAGSILVQTIGKLFGETALIQYEEEKGNNINRSDFEEEIKKEKEELVNNLLEKKLNVIKGAISQ